MNPLLAIPFVILNLVVALRDPRRGAFVYAGLALLLPHPYLAGVSVPYEMLALPPVLGVVAFTRGGVRHPRILFLLLVYLGLVLVGTTVGSVARGATLSPITAIGFVRVLILMALFCETMDRRGIEMLLLVVIGVNAALGTTQLLVPGGEELTRRLYGREGATILDQYVEWGGIPRASGTFISPIVLGSLALFGVAVAWGRLLSGESTSRHRWLFLASGVAGLVSITKTFILGVPIVLASGWFLQLSQQIRDGRVNVRTTATVFAAVTGVAATMVGVGLYLSQIGLPVGYYVGFLTRPLSAFSARYGPGGQLEDAVQVISANLLTGVGLTRVAGEFVGDSLYVSVLHAAGLPGAMFVVAVIAFIAWYNVRAGQVYALLLLIAVLLTGTAIDMVFRLPGTIALAYLVSVPRTTMTPREAVPG